MKRVDGYLNLDKLLGVNIKGIKEEYDAAVKTEEALKNNKNVKIIKCKLGVNLLFTFNIKGELYYFKFDSWVEPMNELFAHEVASRLGFDSVDYDLAQIGPFRGVISKNFVLPNTRYVTPYELLKESRPINDYDDDEDEKLKENYLCEHYFNYNTLEGIWDALEIRYKSRTDKQEIVARLMKKMVDILILDIILNQSDRNLFNWYLIEGKDGSIDIAPIFDNARIFMRHPDFTVLKLTVENKDIMKPLGFSLENNVRKFISTSSEEFKNLLIKSISILKRESVLSIINSIKKKAGHIDEQVAEKYLRQCQIQLEFLLEILGLSNEDELDAYTASLPKCEEEANKTI